MQSMEQFGKPLFSYQGVASVDVKFPEDTLNFEGNFEAAQFISGRLAVSVLPTKRPMRQRVTLVVDHDGEIWFTGHDVEGWTLTLRGQTFYSPIGWKFALLQKPLQEQTLSAQYLEAKLPDASKQGYREATFLITNFLWDDHFSNIPEELTFQFGGMDVIVTPLESYLDVAQRLRKVRGIEPTAQVYIRSSDNQRKPLRMFEDWVGNLLYVFRLVTGNQVNWICGEALDESGNPVQRIHKYSVSANYSEVMKFRPLKKGHDATFPKLSLVALAEVFFEETKLRLSKEDLRSLINQFTNTCESGLNVESSGLLASTLAELVAAKYSHVMGISDKIPEDKFQNEVLPTLNAVIEATYLDSETRKQVKRHLKGAYRTTFADKLMNLSEGLNLELQPKEISRIVRVRNSLVHSGTYLSPLQDGKWADDYDLIVWTNFIALCRLSGYEGELPRFLDWQQLGV